MPVTVSKQNPQQSTAKQGKSVNANKQKPKPQRQKAVNGTAMVASKQQKSRATKPASKTAAQPKQPAKAPSNKSKKLTAIGPNYTESNSKRYKIGREFDARNHMGWRKNERTGSSVQFLFKPKMVSRVDQVYYRNQHEDSERYVHTFAVGIFVQDSTLDRNAILKPQNLSPELQQEYLRNLSNAFDAVLERTQNAFKNNSQPKLVIDG